MTESAPKYLAQVDVYSHGIHVHHFDESIRRACYSYCRHYVEHTFKRVGHYSRQEINKVYAAATVDRTEYFFHANQLEELLNHFTVEGIRLNAINVTHIPMYEPVEIDYDWESGGRTLRDIQVKIREFFAILLPRIKLLTMQAGRGKTISALASIHEQRGRAVIIVSKRYMAGWTKEALQTLKLKKGELYTVQGGKALRDLIELAKEDEDFQEKAKVIIMTNATYRMFIQSFKDKRWEIDGYQCTPLEFFPLLKTKIRIIDETHENFHLNWIIDCMSHVYKSISLSATMDPEDHFRRKLYGIMFKQESYAPTPAYHRYIKVYSIAYRIRDNQRLKFLNFFRQYSHNEYEKSIMKHPTILKGYLKMIADVIHYQFLTHKDYEKGHRCAVYCGMVEFVELVIAELKTRFPELDIRRFVSGDPEANMHEAEIFVTTLGSFGTGKDTKKLTMCFSTIALSKKEANEQMVGRLRDLADQGMNIFPRFVYLYNKENRKHLSYQERRAKNLGDKVKSMDDLASDIVF